MTEGFFVLGVIALITISVVLAFGDYQDRQRRKEQSGRFDPWWVYFRLIEVWGDEMVAAIASNEIEDRFNAMLPGQQKSFMARLQSAPDNRKLDICLELTDKRGAPAGER